MTGERRVRVELLGVARYLARRDEVEVSLPAGAVVQDLTAALLAACPELAGEVLDAEGRLVGGHAVSGDGLEVIRDPNARLPEGDRLLLFSLQAGG